MSSEEAVAWLREQIEVTRRAASPKILQRHGCWQAGGTPAFGGTEIRDQDAVLMAVAIGSYAADLIALSDPQGVLADCEAKLALLDVHTPVEDGTRLTCAVCVTWEDDEGEYEFGIALPVLWPCMTLDIVAAGYRHRVGYAEHWDAQPCPACGKPDVVLPLGHDLAVPMDGSPPSCEVHPPPDPGIVTQFLAYE